MINKFIIILVVTVQFVISSDHDGSPLLEVAKLLFQGNQNNGKESDIGSLAGSLIKGLDPSIIASMLEHVGNSGSHKDGMGNEIEDSPGAGTGPLDLLATFVPLLLQQQGHKHYDDPALEDVQGHEQFDKITSLLPTIISQIWEMFKSSSAWGELWDKSGLGKTLSLFNGPEGRLRLEAAVRSLENHQFRKKWLRSMVSFVMEYVKQFADPGMQKRYTANTISFVNSILMSQGYKPHELFNRGQPFDESLIRVTDLVSRRTFGIQIESAKYIRPVSKYFNELVGIGRGTSISTMSARETEDKLADMLNQEVLEGILRVWQGHKYALRHHKCDKYVLCELNRLHNSQKYVMRPVVTKLSSIVSAWFLSGQTGSSFLSLYDAIVEDYNCQNEFPVDCVGFHEEDLRITTEYAHNEL
uniref:Uncharacterized protein n=1 Tax=Pristhesancus plagipennis TaxID=1955184 RepID=A0A2K8JMJ1_PRIPG|nr:secreted hypothetical protein [Pristhesancus plagipennis]